MLRARLTGCHASDSIDVILLEKRVSARVLDMLVRTGDVHHEVLCRSRLDRIVSTRCANSDSGLVRLADTTARELQLARAGLVRRPAQTR